MGGYIFYILDNVLYIYIIYIYIHMFPLPAAIMRFQVVFWTIQEVMDYAQVDNDGAWAIVRHFPETVITWEHDIRIQRWRLSVLVVD